MDTKHAHTASNHDMAMRGRQSTHKHFSRLMKITLLHRKTKWSPWWRHHPSQKWFSLSHPPRPETPHGHFPGVPLWRTPLESVSHCGASVPSVRTPYPGPTQVAWQSIQPDYIPFPLSLPSQRDWHDHINLPIQSPYKMDHLRGKSIPQANIPAILQAM